MNEFQRFMIAQGMQACRLDEDDWRRMKAKRELMDEALRIHMNICDKHCIFSRSCGKVGDAVLNCQTVQKYQKLGTA